MAEAASSVLAKIVNNALMKATGSVVTEKAVEALEKVTGSAAMGTAIGVLAEVAGRIDRIGKGRNFRMCKELSEMSFEELWELFPISLVAHNDKWHMDYKEMEIFLKDLLSDCPVERISHIGSTAISGIWAKDIVDILVEISQDSVHQDGNAHKNISSEDSAQGKPLFAGLSSIRNPLANHSPIKPLLANSSANPSRANRSFMAAALEDTAKVIENNGFMRMSTKPGRISFTRGYTKAGFADKVFHIHLRYAGDCDELYFRDYLNEHPQVAKEYETLKLKLWKLFEHDRDAYTDAKAAFVRKWTLEAKKIYAGRYR